MNWINRIFRSKRIGTPVPAWTDYAWASVCDYRGFTIVVHICGSRNAYTWTAYKCGAWSREPALGLPPYWEMDYFTVSGSTYAIACEEAKVHSVREVDRHIDGAVSTAAGCPV